ncbi:hypothetical protein BT63DRAFT_432617 [Microthyrium microscopicum]|uniref:Major facilitator superfamily (MFS) profile domain-containing protein n=1 Tax=Microthyrium microscopicum TaxID=703497 RepID=A0A6A6UF88_9PEZI|nr:hypothetical protein BT63DRAFT_432617 [Microthyrium microscopicum]
MDPRTWLRDLTPYFLYLLFISTIGPLLFGYHLDLESTLPQCIPMTPAQLGMVSSIFTLGGLLGALAAGPISASQGRLRTMLFTTIFFAIGPVFEALSPSIAVMAIGRLISGFGAGASVVVVPLYVSEISPPAERGFFGSFTQVMVNGGIFVTQLLGYLLSYGQMWRVVLAAGGAIAVINAIGLFFAAESPKWLAHNGKGRKARELLQKIRGPKFDIEHEVNSWGHSSDDDDEEAVGESAGLLSNEEDVSPAASIKRSRPEHAGMIDVLRHPHHRKAVFAVCMIMIAQQFTGINSIIMYGVTLLADLLESNSALLNLAVSGLNIAVTAGCAPLVDRLGRKSCLIGSIGGMGISSLFLAFGIRYSISAVSAVAVVTFVASFGLGLGPIPFILASELVDAEAVSSTQTWALCFNWVSTFCIAQFFPVVNNALGKGIIYFVFAGISAFFASFVAFYVPESKGKNNTPTNDPFPAHYSPALPPHNSPERNPFLSSNHNINDPPPSLLSPAFTPPSTPGTNTPTPATLRDAKSIPVLPSSTPGPNLLPKLPNVRCQVRARIPTTTGAQMFLYLYTNDADAKEHLAIVFGEHIRSASLDAERTGETERDRMIRGAYVGRLHPGRTSSRVEQIRREAGVSSSPAQIEAERAPLVRIHSECYTGETVWSARCDCGEQLDEAQRLMCLPCNESAGGAIIYLRQEGRGIGLGEKLKAYNLQDLGHDTYEANLLLRHPADARSYGLATAMLVDLGLGGERGIRLLTNNPDKIRAVEGPNREVVVKERVAMIPLTWQTGGQKGVQGDEVEKYLSTKIEKFKHLLSQ